MINTIRYQRLPEDFFDIIRRRKLKPDECFLAIYLRGKYCRFGNPFYLSDKIIFQEINMSYKVLSKIRKRLQVKGVIKYDTFQGRGLTPIYTMLDTCMTPVLQRKPPQMGNKPYQMGRFFKNNLSTKTSPNGQPNNKNKDKKEFEDFVDTRPKNWKEQIFKEMGVS